MSRAYLLNPNRVRLTTSLADDALVLPHRVLRRDPCTCCRIRETVSVSSAYGIERVDQAAVVAYRSAGHGRTPGDRPGWSPVPGPRGTARCTSSCRPAPAGWQREHVQHAARNRVDAAGGNDVAGKRLPRKRIDTPRRTAPTVAGALQVGRHRRQARHGAPLAQEVDAHEDERAVAQRAGRRGSRRTGCDRTAASARVVEGVAGVQGLVPEVLVAGDANRLLPLRVMTLTWPAPLRPYSAL